MWIFCGGMARSASTLQFQIASNLVELTKCGRVIGWTDEFPLTKEKYQNLKGMKVVKSHACTKEMEHEFKLNNAKGIYIYRDIRDVAISLMQKNNSSFDDLLSSGKIDNAIYHYNKWTLLPNMLISRYEDSIDNLKDETRRIARHLDIDISENDLISIAENLSINRQKERMKKINLKNAVFKNENNIYDPKTLLHTNHIKSGEIGGFKRKLSEKNIRQFEKIYGTWLKTNKYELQFPEKK